MNTSHALKGREDISQFVVHLTRDDRKDFEGGALAEKNFWRIYKDKRIRGFQAHCLYNPLLAKVDSKISSKFNVACFTETPLNQLHRLVRAIPGRSVVFEPFGFCFKKQFLVEKGAQQAIYINSYGGNRWLKGSAMSLFNRCVKDGDLAEPDWRLLPFINAMHEKYDFSWEREWRVLGDLDFKRSDIVCVILPSEGHDDLKETFALAGIATISPGWTYEEIVAELASQQRATRDAVKALEQLASNA